MPGGFDDFEKLNTGFKVSQYTRLCERKITKYKAQLGHVPSPLELCTKLSERADSVEDEEGILHFVLMRHAYLEQAVVKNPIIFDELWDYTEQAQ